MQINPRGTAAALKSPASSDHARYFYPRMVEPLNLVSLSLEETPSSPPASMLSLSKVFHPLKIPWATPHQELQILFLFSQKHHGLFLVYQKKKRDTNQKINKRFTEKVDNVCQTNHSVFFPHHNVCDPHQHSWCWQWGKKSAENFSGKVRLSTW